MYKEIPKRVSAGFSAESFAGRREWHDIVKELREKKLANQKYSSNCSSELKEI